MRAPLVSVHLRFRDGASQTRVLFATPTPLSTSTPTPTPTPFSTPTPTPTLPNDVPTEDTVLSSLLARVSPRRSVITSLESSAPKSREESNPTNELGQMTVELAFLIPVVIVVALIIVNLGFYTSACAQFDRAAADITLSHGAAPSDEQSAIQVQAEIQSALKQVMGDNIDVDVELNHVDQTKTNALFTLNPTRIQVTCSMHFHPVPSDFSISGVSLNTPFELLHEKALVIDLGPAGLGVDA